MAKNTKYLVCDCEKTMNLDATVLSKQLGVDDLRIQTHLCRSQIGVFESALNEGKNCVVACTQEAPLFTEVATETGYEQELNFVNIRETGGWSSDHHDTNPKIAALLKASQLETQAVPLKSIVSDGLCLVYGSGQQALEVALSLSRSLSVTLLLSDHEPLSIPPVLDIPIFKGSIQSLEGSLGKFSLKIDQYSALLPSSKTGQDFTLARDGATTECSVIFDMSGGQPLVSGHSKRDGYFRVDPGDPVSLYRKVMDAQDLVGEFEKPIYVRYDADICAHARSTIVGCSNCLDLCPAGAITSVGDHISIDAEICGGCGSCHASCPTGAVSYQYPDQNDWLRKIMLLSSAFSDAGGQRPVLLIYNEQSGFEMISMIARYGGGLPANVIPVAVHSIASLGHVELLSSVSAGFGQVFVVGNQQQVVEYDGLKAEIEIAKAICAGLSIDANKTFELICEADPENVERSITDQQGYLNLTPKPFQPLGKKRDVARSAFSALKSATDSSVELFALPTNAPYGVVNIEQEKCTLCMACVSACPAEAMIDTPGEPRLRFIESACVQCGLCAKTCPESALALEPRLNLSSSAMQPITLNEEEPFCCIQCGEAFATKSTIERISNQLAGKHSMFSSDATSQLLKMCENCRIEVQANTQNDPFAQGERPKVRTTQDYLDAEDAGLSIEDFLIKQ